MVAIVPTGKMIAVPMAYWDTREEAEIDRLAFQNWNHLCKWEVRYEPRFQKNEAIQLLIRIKTVLKLNHEYKAESKLICEIDEVIRKAKPADDPKNR